MKATAAQAGIFPVSSFRGLVVGHLLGCGPITKGVGQLSHSFHGWKCLAKSKGLSCPGGAEQREEARGHFAAASLCAASSSPAAAGATSLWQVSPLKAPLFGARRSLAPHS